MRLARRNFLKWMAGASAAAVCGGCDEHGDSAGRLLAVWGRRGVSDGRFNKPRAMTIDARDELYIVDITARIQVFTTDGQFLRGWQTPVHVNGRPTGMSIDRQGNLRVADTHYYRVLTYSPSGELLSTLGGTFGQGPGDFGFVTDVADDPQGNLYVSEYGEYDRIQKFTAAGEFILEWGGHGTEIGKFSRPQSMAIDRAGLIWVADACNHRVQVFDLEGRFVKSWGRHGTAAGELAYPYGLVLDDAGHVYVTEYGNHRVQKFSPDGDSLGCWGSNGRQRGEVLTPWALARDSHGVTYVLDTGNNRVQAIEL